MSANHPQIPDDTGLIMNALCNLILTRMFCNYLGQECKNEWFYLDEVLNLQLVSHTIYGFT